MLVSCSLREHACTQEILFSGAMDYHTTYRAPEGQTTEWDDIQIKMGNMAPRPKKEKAPKFEGEVEEAKDADWVKRLDEDELSDIEDDLEDERFLKELRCAYDSNPRLIHQNLHSCSD